MLATMLYTFKQLVNFLQSVIKFLQLKERRCQPKKDYEIVFIYTYNSITTTNKSYHVGHETDMDASDEESQECTMSVHYRHGKTTLVLNRRSRCIRTLIISVLGLGLTWFFFFFLMACGPSNLVEPNLAKYSCQIWLCQIWLIACV